MASKAAVASEQDTEVEREHQVAARKFRPRQFADVIGQDHIIKPLQRKVVEHKVGHAYLFVGQRGCGKTTTARLLAMAMNCPNVSDSGEPCGTCGTCNGIINGSGAIGLHELDAASKRGVGDMITLIDTMAMGSVAKKKTYIIDECHMLTNEASNALLKTLEEPPADTLIILCTTEAQKVLPTIKSRAVTYNFKTVDSDTMTPLIKSVIEATGVEIDDAGIEEIIRRGNGSPRDTLTALEGYGGDVEVATSDYTPKIARAIAEKDATLLVVTIAESINAGIGVPDLTRALLEHWRNCLLFLQAPAALSLSADALKQVEKDAKSLKTNKVIRLLTVTSEATSKMSSSTDTRLLLETTLLQVALPETAESIDGLYDYLDDIMAEVKKLSKIVREGVSVRQPSEWPPAEEKVAPAQSPAPAKVEEAIFEEPRDEAPAEDPIEDEVDESADQQESDLAEEDDESDSDDEDSSYDDYADDGEDESSDDDYDESDSSDYEDDEDNADHAGEDDNQPVLNISDLLGGEESGDSEDEDDAEEPATEETEQERKRRERREQKEREAREADVVVAGDFHDDNDPNCICSRCEEENAEFEQRALRESRERELEKAADKAPAKLRLVKGEDEEPEEAPKPKKKVSPSYSREDCPDADSLMDVIQEELVDQKTALSLRPQVMNGKLRGDVLVLTLKQNSKYVPSDRAIRTIQDTVDHLWVSDIEYVD